MDQTFEKRKKVILDFMGDDLYVPMKIKEIAAVLQIPGEQREELRKVLDALVRKGRFPFPSAESTAVDRRVVLRGSFRQMQEGLVL